MDALVTYLKERPLPLVQRDNVSDGPVQSMTLGMVKCRQQGQCQIARSTTHDNFQLLKLLLGLLADKALKGSPPAEFTSLCVNVNYECQLHTDKYNDGQSTIITGGSFSGGELFVETPDGDYAIHRGDSSLYGVKLDAKHRWQEFDGSRRHATLPYIGFRISVVIFSVPSRKCTPHDLSVLHSLGFRVPLPRFGCWPWPYTAFICSSGRSETIRSGTLQVLLGDGSVPPQAVTICTKQTEADQYMYLGLSVIVSRHGGLPEQRAVCRAGLPDNSWALFLDDDVVDILKLGQSTMHELLLFGFMECAARGSLLWGLNTSTNKMHLRKNISGQIGLVNGYFFGLIISDDAGTMTRTSDGMRGAAEDAERSVRYFQRSGICRLNFATALAANHTNDGGLQAEFADKRARAAAQEYVIRTLACEFPHLLEFDQHNANYCKFNRRRELGEPAGNVCKHCGKEYARRVDLKHHIAWEHTGSRPETFECIVCRSNFKTKRALHVHMAKNRCFKSRGRPKAAT